PHPAVVPCPAQGGVDTPAHVGPVGHDRSHVGPLHPPAPVPLGRQEAVAAHESQHPLARDPDGLLAPKPGPDLAVALAAERALTDHILDGGEDLCVGDRARWPGAVSATGRTGRDQPSVIQRRARRLEDAAHHRDRVSGLHGHRGRFCGGIWSPLFRAAARRISFSMVSSPTLRSACRNRRSSSVESPRPIRVFSASLPPEMKSSRHAARRWASTPTSRDTSSMASPRNRRTTTASTPSDCTSWPVPSPGSALTWWWRRRRKTCRGRARPSALSISPGAPSCTASSCPTLPRSTPTGSMDRPLSP